MRRFPYCFLTFAGGMVDPRLFIKSGWMPPTLRFALLACRPWSVPASLVPTALTAGLVYDRVPSIAHIVLPIVGGVCLHMFGNLINTWCVVPAAASLLLAEG